MSGGLADNQQVARLLRYSGLMAPLGLTLYGSPGLASAPPAYQLFYLIIATFGALLGVMQFIAIKKTSRCHALYLTNYFLLLAAYALLIFGFTPPVVLFWVILIMACFVQFGNAGLRKALLASGLIMATDISFTMIFSRPIATLTEDSAIFIIILFVSLMLVGIYRALANFIPHQSTPKEATLERDRILTLVNNLADAILSTDQKGNIQLYNAASLNLLDTNVNLNGQAIDDVITLYTPANDPIKLSRELAAAHSVIERDDLHMRLNSDEDIRLSVTYSPIRGSYTHPHQTAHHDGYILILRDITKMKSLEEERDEFISVVSHELRTPITIAEGTISNAQLMMGRSDIAPSVLQDAIKTAHDQVIYLAKMVNDLSTLSRAERGVADTTEVIDVKELTQKLFMEYRTEAEAKGLHFNLDSSTKLGKVIASRLYLEELLQNFITNSIKYTREGSITFKVHTSDDQVIFAVSDTGIGISQSDQKKIFQKFYRSEDYRTRETGGTGLGLYVAAKLAKKIGCKIELESRLNHGSTFRFSLPLMRSDSPLK